MKLTSFFPIFVSVFTALIFVGCGNNVLPEPTEGQVQFYFEGKINGETVKWEAGKNQYYLQTNAISSSFPSNAPFVGKLRIPQDSNRNVLEIYFMNPALQNSASADTFFQPKAFDYQVASTASDSATVRFQALGVSSANIQYNWDFGDGTSSMLPTITHTFANPYQEYTITLNVAVNDGQNICNSVLTQQIIPAKVVCRENFTYMPINGSERQIQFQATENQYWDFGDGSPVVFGQNPVHLYSSKGVFTVTAQTDTSVSCQSYVAKNIEVGDIGGCGINFSAISLINPQNPSILIVYKDSDGVRYSSETTPQLANAYFTLVKTENIIENQQKIKKLTLLFDCEVRNTAGEVIRIQGEKVVWGVRTP